MKKIVIFMYFFLVLFSSIFSQSNKKINTAVLEFKVSGQASKDMNLGSGIQEIIMTQLGQNPLIQLIERAQLEEVIKELSLQQSDLFSTENSLKLGKFLKVENIITGSIIKIGEKIRVNARIIDIESAKVKQTFLVDINNNNEFFTSLERISQDIEGTLISKSLDYQNKNAVKIEIAFVIDSTGSMYDEIDTVKNKINFIINKTLNANPRPIVKIAVIDYKDEEDDYITKIFPFTTDFTSLRKHINSLTAQGGGDYPEQIDKALIEALRKLDWSPKGASKMIFLIGDAPPHNPQTEKIIKLANSKNISIHTIACSGIDDQGVNYFKELAKRTNASFSFLSYKQEFVSDEGETQNIITQGEKIYIQRIPSDKRQTQRESDEDVAEIARTRQFKYQWGDIAADKNKIIRQQGLREERENNDSISISRNQERVERAYSAENIKIRGMKPAGEMENNLDSILIQNIQKQASRDLKIQFLKQNDTKIYGSALVENSQKKVWIFFNNKEEFEKIKNMQNKLLWISGRVIKNNNDFIITNVQISPKIVPQLGIKNFIDISKKISFFEKNGISANKLWFFEVKIDTIKKLEN